jgi:hypothetical protein
MRAKSKQSRSSQPKFLDYLSPTFIACCQDVIVGQDKSVSLLRLVDSYMSASFPTPPIPRLCIVFELQRNISVPIDDLYAAKLKYWLKLVAPGGEEQPLSKFGLPELDPKIPWESTKAQHNASASLSFKTPGMHFFRLMGQVGSGPEEQIAELPFPVKKAPDLNGNYKAEIKTAAGREIATVSLLNGVISGTGEGTKLNGIYAAAASKILAQVTVQPSAHADSYRVHLAGDIGARSIQMSGMFDGDRKVDVNLTKLDKPSSGRKKR